ncbi:MAG: apolipoprotein N-acyltransferase [Alphaproteobacteria bacterium]|nr:apolipoprotein N-acyltransferase [Alphaproteobacteria bacterium]
MNVCVNYENKKWKKYKIDFTSIATLAAGSKYKNSEVSITLINDKKIHKLNKQYRNIDRPTNVLSFELGDDVLLGDIFISLDTVKREAKEVGISVEEHTAHMVVHGVLHLLGFDHLTDAQAKIMESKEIKIMKLLGYKNPYKEEIKTNRCTLKECSCKCPVFINKIINLLNKPMFRNIILVVLGMLCSLGFAPFYLWWLFAVCFGLAYYLIIILSKPNKSFIKYLLQALPFTSAYSISMFWWVLHSIYVVPELTAQFAVWTIPGILGIGVVCGVFFAVPFAVTNYFFREHRYQRTMIFSCLCSIGLWLREWFCTGFPWNPVSNITINFPVIANSMSFWGSLGLSFVVVGCIVGCVEIFYKKTNVVNFILFVCLLVMGCVFGEHNIRKTENLFHDDFPIIRIVQPAKSAVYKLDDVNSINNKIKTLLDLATKDSSLKPDIIVYPETTYPYVVTQDNFPLARVLNTNVISGGNYYSDGRLYNTMIVADKFGKIDNIYNKSHLVPFGEYRPLGNLIPTPGQLSAGNGPETIHLKTNHGDFSFAPAICYEIIFSDSLVPNNVTPNAIINITNDTWFGTTPGTFQHLDMVRRYAIESGLPIVRANYSGISAFITPDGRITSLLPIGQAGSLDGFVYGAHDTIYRRIGRDMWMIIILMFSIIASISIYVFQKKD